MTNDEVVLAYQRLPELRERVERLRQEWQHIYRELTELGRRMGEAEKVTEIFRGVALGVLHGGYVYAVSNDSRRIAEVYPCRDDHSRWCLRITDRATLRPNDLLVSKNLDEVQANLMAREWVAFGTPRLEHERGLLLRACQLFTQGLGSPTGYYPTLGAVKTAEALDLMRRCGVRPIWYDDQT